MSLPWALRVLEFYMVTRGITSSPDQRVTACWARAKASRQSLGGLQVKAGQKLHSGSKSHSHLSKFPCPSGSCPSKGQDKKTDSVPWTARLLWQAAKSTTTQSQIVNTSADWSLLSESQVRKPFLEHCQQLGGNKYLSTYVCTLRRWDWEWTLDLKWCANKLVQNPLISSWHWLRSSAGLWSCKLSPWQDSRDSPKILLGKVFSIINTNLHELEPWPMRANSSKDNNRTLRN